MRKQLRPLVFLFLLGASSAHGAESKLLLPIVVPTPLAGAFGSLWTTHVTVVNVGTQSIKARGLLPPCGFDPCIQPELPPKTTTAFSPYMGSDVPGRFLLVDTDRRADIKVELRVRDLSRQLSTWGTEIPVIDEAKAAQETVQLLAVPVDTDFRSLLRVYDFDPAPGHFVVVRVFVPRAFKPNSPNPDELLKEISLLLHVPRGPDEYPGYAQLNIDGLVDPLSGNLRIEVTPTTTGLRFWAFVSVTNNDTQHVTVITPQ